VALFSGCVEPQSTTPDEANITMKRLFTILTISTLALGLPTGGFAAEKKAKPADATPAAPAKPAAEKVAGEGKPMPMNAEVSTIDAAGKSFTHKNKDGKEVKFVITDKTEIKNGEAAAKLADIKVGDWVGGMRLKKSDTEYEVLKITKFGPKAEKKEGAKKPEGEKKPEGAAKPEAKKS
jgi:hypothetical protein